ncbi:hypothetical protein [Sorangium sp. So ce1078]|uniref:hypothetical protein n=1 Tax=Sorangium sp. So ce1078 TaxID=3133329 RepID=UPI003F62F037
MHQPHRPPIALGVAVAALSGVGRAITGAMMPRSTTFLLRVADFRTPVVRDHLGGDRKRGALFVFLAWRRGRVEVRFRERRVVVLAAAGTDLCDGVPGRQIGAGHLGGREPRLGLAAAGSKRDACFLGGMGGRLSGQAHRSIGTLHCERPGTHSVISDAFL